MKQPYLTSKDQHMIAAMSPAGTKHFTPVQVQKMFFLLDKNIAKHTLGPHFDFEPHGYGPFDKEVYRGLECLENKGLVEIFDLDKYGLRRYRLTDEGREIGEKLLSKLPQSVQDYNKTIVKFIRGVSFAQLVTAIYDVYPEMKENSVFAHRSE